MSCAMIVDSCLVCVYKQKDAYEMRISDWSSDVCSSDLRLAIGAAHAQADSRRPIAAARRGEDQDRLSLQRQRDRRVPQQLGAAHDQRRQFRRKGQAIAREMALPHDRIGMESLNLHRRQPPFLDQPMTGRAEQRHPMTRRQPQTTVDGPATSAAGETESLADIERKND